MGFRFRLRPVLRLRKRVEDGRALGLAVAVQRRDGVARRLDALRRDTAGYRQAVIAASREGATGAEIRSMADAVAATWRAARATASRLVTEDTAVAAARADLVAASRDRRVLERVEAIQRAAHEATLRGVEQRLLDDLASIHHGRRRAGGGPRA